MSYGVYIHVELTAKQKPYELGGELIWVLKTLLNHAAYRRHTLYINI